jgi:chromosome segregation ATPase
MEIAELEGEIDLTPQFIKDYKDKCEEIRSLKSSSGQNKVIVELQSRIEELTQQKERIEDENKDLRSKVEWLENQFDKLETVKRNLQEQIEEKDKIINDLDKKLKENQGVQRELENRNEEIENLKKQIRSKDEEIQRLHKQLDETGYTSNGDLATLREEIRQLRAQNDWLNCRIEELRARIRELET